MGEGRQAIRRHPCWFPSVPPSGHRRPGVPRTHNRHSRTTSAPYRRRSASAHRSGGRCRFYGPSGALQGQWYRVSTSATHMSSNRPHRRRFCLATLTAGRRIDAGGPALARHAVSVQERIPTHPADRGKGGESLPSACRSSVTGRIAQTARNAGSGPNIQSTPQHANTLRTADSPAVPRHLSSQARYEPITARQIARNWASVSSVCCTRPCHLTLSVISFTWSSVALSPCLSR